MEMRSLGEDAYFAASNSASGFCSYYKECFDTAEIDAVYAIKGGPGTGKSWFLRTVAERGIAAGWRCEFVYCSSDPDSLDGVILRGNGKCIALLDATAPHTYEPRLPGARECLIDLGAFWNAEVLRDHKAEIEARNQEKSAAWARAYRCLESYGLMDRTAAEIVRPFVRREALYALAAKLMIGIAEGKCYAARPALIRSFGMKGDVAFDTYFALADRIIVLEDCKGCAAYLMEALGEEAVRRRCRIRISHHPLLPDCIDGMFFEDDGVAIVVAKGEEIPDRARRIDLRRFVRVSAMRAVKGEWIYTERMKRAMLAGASDALAVVREQHFALEEIYKTAMDFSAKERFSEAFCEKLFCRSCQNREPMVE